MVLVSLIRLCLSFGALAFLDRDCRAIADAKAAVTPGYSTFAAARHLYGDEIIRTVASARQSAKYHQECSGNILECIP
jgi:hypothetical protein